MPGVDGGSRGLRLAARIEIAAAEQVRSRDYGRSHGAVFIRALRPRNLVIQPQVEAHAFMVSERQEPSKYQVAGDRYQIVRMKRLGKNAATGNPRNDLRIGTAGNVE